MDNSLENNNKRSIGPLSPEKWACAPLVPHDTEKDKEYVVIPYFVHEAEVMRMEKHTRRLWVALLVAILAILASNIAWLWYINQYDFVDYDFEQDGYGVNIIGDGNGVNDDGTGPTCENEDEEETQ